MIKLCNLVLNFRDELYIIEFIVEGESHGDT